MGGGGRAGGVGLRGAAGSEKPAFKVRQRRDLMCCHYHQLEGVYKFTHIRADQLWKKIIITVILVNIEITIILTIISMPLSVRSLSLSLSLKKTNILIHGMQLPSNIL